MTRLSKINGCEDIINLMSNISSLSCPMVDLRVDSVRPNDSRRPRDPHSDLAR